MKRGYVHKTGFTASQGHAHETPFRHLAFRVWVQVLVIESYGLCDNALSVPFVRCRMSNCAATDCDDRRPALHTSLLVPTFHLESNHAVLFWHGRLGQHVSARSHDSSPQGAFCSEQRPGAHTGAPAASSGAQSHAWGFTTINRLRFPSWLQESLRTGSSGRQYVDIRFNSKTPAQARLVFESSGDTLHVYSLPPQRSPRGAAAGGMAVRSNSWSSTDSMDAGGVGDIPAAGSKPDQHPGRPAATALAIGDGRAEVLDFNLWEVVRASTAAPTFFPGRYS